MPKFHTTIVFNNYLMIANLHEELIKAGMKKIMEQVKANAKKTLAPGHGYDTGTLQKGIYYRHVEQAVYEMYTNIEYAVYVEFGTSKMSAIPFFFPAANKGRTAVEAMIGAVLAQGT